MRKLIVFQHSSLDGYFTDRFGEMTWAKQDSDEEFNSFASENARQGGVLIFGRITYDLMVSFWPTPAAHEMLPEVAERMNNGLKIVFSKSMASASWNNTTLINEGELITHIRRLKSEDGPGLVILGSGSLVAQIAPHGLIDEYQVVINPVALGGGRTMFEGIPNRLELKLARSRVFKNGKVFLAYQPTA